MISYFVIMIGIMVLFVLPFAIYDLMTYSRYHNSVVKDAVVWLTVTTFVGFIVAWSGIIQNWILNK